MSQLPEYLRYVTHAAPRQESVVSCGGVRITAITDQLIRIEQGACTDEATLAVIRRDFGACVPQVEQEGGVIVIRTGVLEIRCDGTLEGLTIRRDAHPAFLWHFGQKPVQNLGGTTSTLDEVNGSCPVEDGVCARDGFAFIDDSATPIIRQDGWFAPRQACTDMYFFGYGHDYTACVQDYYRLTGAPEMLPAFALGNWWSRYHAYSDEEYLTLMDRFQQEDVPLSVGIVDMDWHLTDGDGRRYWEDGWTGYTWNEKLFPDYKAFIKGLHDRGLKTALNLHPSSGVRHWDVQYEDMAKALGVDPATKDPVTFDCLHPEFLKAYFEILHFPYEKDGVDFWWMDWQQGNDYPSIVGKRYRETGLECIHPLWMVNHTHYLASKREGKRGMIFSRFGGYGSQRYPIGFSGDTYISWASLDFQPWFTATASNVGYSWWSHDIGGHMQGVRDDELTVRWIQFGVFSPIFRLHSTDSVFLGREPWNYNKRAELIIDRFMRLRHQLFPYLYTMNHRNAAELLPLILPMYHTHPEAAEAYQVPNQYWFGSELIAAPITHKADESDLGSTTAWLPQGLWTDAFTGYVYHGDQTLDLHRPMEQMPLLMKAGAIVPMQAHTPQSRQLGKAEEMEVYIAPGASNTFTLYEDDGESMAWQQGDCVTTALQLDWTETSAAFTLGKPQGNTALIPASRRWTLHFRGFRKGCRLEVNGQPAAASYDAVTNTYTLTVADGAAVRIMHEVALTHDNSDCRARIVDALTRAQGPQQDKTWLLERADALLDMAAQGTVPRYCKSGADAHHTLGGLIYELCAQLI